MVSLSAILRERERDSRLLPSSPSASARPLARDLYAARAAAAARRGGVGRRKLASEQRAPRVAASSGDRCGPVI